MIAQKLIYDDNYNLREYIEYSLGKKVLRKLYDKRGNILLLEYTTGEWDRWIYDEHDYVTYTENHKGQWTKRRFSKDRKISFEQTQDGVTYWGSYNRK